MKYEVTVVKSKRKTFAIQIKPDLSIVVRAPMKATKRDVLRMLEQNDAWIEENLRKVKDRGEQLKREALPKLGEEEIRTLHKKAHEYIPKRVKYYAPLVGVTYSRITIRMQKTRWGSCSNKGGLNFNCLLMKTPPEVIDYVVVHELCHRKQMNHSPQFWAEVESVLPEYKVPRKWLKEHGNLIMHQAHDE